MPAGTATGIATGTDERGAYGYLVSPAPARTTSCARTESSS